MNSFRLSGTMEVQSREQATNSSLSGTSNEHSLRNPDPPANPAMPDKIRASRASVCVKDLSECSAAYC